MNIFILDLNPEIAASYLCDKHLVKMPLEAAQIMCSVRHKLGLENSSYKPTHINHPCVNWAAESYMNYHWLFAHGVSICDWYRHVYNKHHKSQDVLVECFRNTKSNLFPIYNQTPFVACMDDLYLQKDIVSSYRCYYKHAKKHMLKYTKRNKPEWL